MKRRQRHGLHVAGVQATLRPLGWRLEALTWKGKTTYAVCREGSWRHALQPAFFDRLDEVVTHYSGSPAVL